MRKNKFLILSLILCFTYIGLLFYDQQNNTKGEMPVITMQQKDEVTSVNVKEKELLKGVSVTDKEDGSLTNDVFIESISPFDQNNQRTVNYAVFDSDDNLTTATRKISYRDYKKPKLMLVKPVLVPYLGDKNMFKSLVRATSSVDGNIDDQVIVERVYMENSDYYIDYSVTDSCGGTDELKLKVDIIDSEKKVNLDIQLTKYLLEVQKGTNIEPKNYIKDVKKYEVSRQEYISEIDITSNYDKNKPGIYDIIYEINLSNGDYGITKLSVIVK